MGYPFDGTNGLGVPRTHVRRMMTVELPHGRSIQERFKHLIHWHYRHGSLVSSSELEGCTGTGILGTQVANNVSGGVGTTAFLDTQSHQLSLTGMELTSAISVVCTTKGKLDAYQPTQINKQNDTAAADRVHAQQRRGHNQHKQTHTTIYTRLLNRAFPSRPLNSELPHMQPLTNLSDQSQNSLAHALPNNTQ